MPSNLRSSRWSQILAWAIAGLFVLGFFFHPIGMWTGPILGVWFVGTQKPLRGFLWMLAIAFIPSLIFGWRGFPLTGPSEALQFLGWMLLAALLSVLPFTFHRLTSPRLPPLLSTLPLPLAVVTIQSLVPPLPLGGFATGSRVDAFLISWFAAVVIRMWNADSGSRKAAGGVARFAAAFLFAEGFLLLYRFGRAALPISILANAALGWLFLGGAAVLSVWAVLNPRRNRSWADRKEAVAQLQSPFTGNPLRVESEHGQETLVSTSGERFAIREGIPSFLRAEDLTGDNGKYNHLYETIGGFYDDTQRLFGAFRGLDLDSYFLNYMSLMDVKPGDSVLETTVGTGLNFKYLPRGVKLIGLDLSREMLTNCQANLRRWEMDADLYLGNAEYLPFANSSFDVVYTAGGFNFFSDRAKAIQEMIRVAKPGGHLMIEDETEEYVKSTYENIPFTSSFYKGREQAVSVPIDMVPPEMEDIHLEMLKDGKFYAITFRKPLAVGQTGTFNETVELEDDHRDLSRGPAAMQLHPPGR